jgi:acyl-CoA dehydrogenase
MMDGAQRHQGAPGRAGPDPAGLNGTSYLDSGYLALPFFDDTHRAVAARLQGWLRDNEAAISALLAQSPKQATRGAITMLGDAGWFAAALGEPVDFRAICIMREAFAYRDDLLDFAFSIQVLAALSLLQWGSQDLRRRLLPALVRGERVAAFAMTERDSGSDLAAVALAAVETAAGYRLTGEKNWIANADIADHVVVLARTGSGSIGLSLFVADTSDGVDAVPVALIAPRPFGDLRFDGCLVSKDRLIGDNGAGLAIALDTLEQMRMSVGAAANGFARRALDEARRHVTKVRANGRLAEIAAVRQKLAQMGVAVHTARLAVAQAAWEMDRGGEGRSVSSSVAKLVATEAAQSVVDACVQLHGAAGVVSQSLPERLYRQVRSLRIYEGTSEIQEAIIGEAVTFGFLG